jgi:hypothetical protein
VSKRTTLTLDDDVAARLDIEARRSGRPFRDVVNEALRRGLETRAHPERFEVEPRPMGLQPGFDVDCVAALLDRLDGPMSR